MKFILHFYISIRNYATNFILESNIFSFTVFIFFLDFQAYLCLPGSQSLADGHCLIIPMQHTQSATSLDEDVWAEIQVISINNNLLETHPMGATAIT